MRRIISLILIDIVKNKVVIAYTLLLMLFSWSVFGLEETSNKAFLTLLNLLLLIVPLVSSLFTTIYIYNSSEFIELLVSQPIQRSTIWKSLFLSICTVMILSFFLGIGIPLLIFVEWNLALSLLVSGSLLSLCFASLAFLAAIVSRDKAKGIGIALIAWLFFALLFDGVVMFLSFQFSDYPIESFMVFFAASNPIDLTRIYNIIQLDTSAMLGYTGAIFKSYFDNGLGRIVALVMMAFWTLLPFWLSLRIFKKKDL